MNNVAALLIALTAAITGQTVSQTELRQTNAAYVYMDEYSLTVNKTTNCVTVYQKTTTGDFVPVKAMICSVGKDDYNNETPSGSYKTQAKYEWRPLFGNVYGQYATRINGHILFHSVYYKTTDPSSLKTEEYNKLGTSASAGCVRLTAADAKWIYDNCSLGTTVNIIERDSDPLPRPEAIKLGSNAPYPNWDPTDPDPANPWHKEGAEIVIGDEVKEIKASDALTSAELTEVLKNNVTAYDAANNVIDYSISCNISTVTPGIYSVKYYTTDCLGNEAENYTTLKVLDA